MPRVCSLLLCADDLLSSSVVEFTCFPGSGSCRYLPWLKKFYCASFDFCWWLVLMIPLPMNLCKYFASTLILLLGAVCCAFWYSKIDGFGYSCNCECAPWGKNENSLVLLALFSFLLSFLEDCAASFWCSLVLIYFFLLSFFRAARLPTCTWPGA